MKRALYVLGAIIAVVVAFLLGRRGSAPATLDKETYDAIEEEAKAAGKAKAEELSRLPAHVVAARYSGVAGIRAAARAETSAVRNRLRAVARSGGGAG